jgi:hypothetical protein
MNVLCERCSQMTDTLLELAIKLSIAASQMADAAGTSQDSAFLSAKAEVERLRDDCERVKAEIARHRIRHRS